MRHTNKSVDATIPGSSDVLDPQEPKEVGLLHVGGKSSPSDSGAAGDSCIVSNMDACIVSNMYPPILLAIEDNYQSEI